MSPLTTIEDTEGLRTLIERWRGPLVGLLSARGASWARAEELAQDVFAEAWLGRERFHGDEDDERAVGAWLAGIARNLQRGDVRRLARVESEPPEGSVDSAEPEHDPEAAEEAARVREAIGSLPEREREVVRAFYLEETSTARVAALLETTERAVEGLLHRARKRLRVLLSRPVGSLDA